MFLLAQLEAQLPVRNDHLCQGALGVSSWHKAERLLSVWEQAVCPIHTGSAHARTFFFCELCART